MRGTCQPPRNGPRAPCLSPRARQGRPEAALQSGADEVHQAPQLLLQGPRVPVVLHDPVEALHVVQATLRLRVVHPCVGSKARSGPVRLGPQAPEEPPTDPPASPLSPGATLATTHRGRMRLLKPDKPEGQPVGSTPTPDSVLWEGV